MTTGASFRPWIDGTTTGVSFSTRMGRLQGCHLVLGWDD